MATQDKSTDDEVLDDDQEEVENEVDNASEDETQDEEQDDSDEETEDGEDSEDEEDSEDDSEDEDDEPEFTKAFSQIKGDTLEDYTPNLEEAYRKSSREGRKLAEDKKELQSKLDVVAAVIAKNPELAKAIENAGASAAIVDPTLMKLRQDTETQQLKEYNEFSDSHPRLEAEEDLRKDVFDTMSELSAAAQKRGKVLSMSDALKKAWAIVVDDDDEKEEKIVNKAKENASRKKSNSGGGKKPAPSKAKGLTAEQIAVAKKFGLTEAQLLATK